MQGCFFVIALIILCLVALYATFYSLVSGNFVFILLIFSFCIAFLVIGKRRKLAEQRQLYEEERKARAKKLEEEKRKEQQCLIEKQRKEQERMLTEQIKEREQREEQERLLERRLLEQEARLKRSRKNQFKSYTTPATVMNHDTVASNLTQVETYETQSKDTIANASVIEQHATRLKNLIEIHDSYVVIDIETTGLSPASSEIIEVAALKIENGDIVSKYQSLVNPNVEISRSITNITGITNEMVSAAPTIEDVLPDYLDFIGDEIVVGHNVSFDIRFIDNNSTHYLGRSFANESLDTLSLSRKLFSGVLSNHKLATIAEYFNLKTPIHRALGDCETVYLFYSLICKYTPEDDASANEPLIKLRNINANNPEPNVANPIYGKCFVFSGKFKRMTHYDAQQIVTDFGGFFSDGAVAKADYLVVENAYYNSPSESNKSAKIKKAEAFILSGRDLKIISEDEFYSFVEQEQK